MQNYDLVVIGQGSAAFVAAIKANELGIRTANVEANVTRGTLIGGTCVNVGCVPSKNMITVGNIFYQHSGDRFGAIKYGKSKLDFRKLMAEKDALVRKFRKEKYSDVMNGLDNVEHIPKLGRFISGNEVKVDGRVIKGKNFIIATGAQAKVPQIEGMRELSYLTNEDALSLKEFPVSMIIVGGRALGLEFAQMYAHFGTKVTVLQRNERILPEEEPEISQALKFYLEEEGVAIYAGVTVKGVSQRGKKKVVSVRLDKEEKQFTAEQVLFATGRRPNTDYLTPEKAGVELDSSGFANVNNRMQTSAPTFGPPGTSSGNPCSRP